MNPSSCGYVWPLVALLSPSLLLAQGPGVSGERLPPSAITPIVVESMEEVMDRERSRPRSAPRIRGWDGQDGRWVVPSLGVRLASHSGIAAIVNEWGDPKIGVHFGRPMDVDSVCLAGHGVTPADSIDVVGFVQGVEVGRYRARGLDANRSQLFAVDLIGVDRLEFVVGPPDRVAFFALDDVVLRPTRSSGRWETIDFEDLGPRAVVTGSRYRGLEWEAGTGLRAGSNGQNLVDAPRVPSQSSGGRVVLESLPQAQRSTVVKPPGITHSFAGPRLGGGYPTDHCIAAGPDHVVSVINSTLSAFERGTGRRVVNTALDSFWGQWSGSVGDPRAHWDDVAQRFVILATTFFNTSQICVAVSQTADPRGSWVKFSFRADLGADSGKWPDYPTLGHDQNGLYTSAYMVGGGSASMTLWAIDKAWFSNPSAGTPAVTAFRSLPWEGAIQPCATQTPTDPVYIVSARQNRLGIRLRRIQWAGQAPSLIELGTVPVPYFQPAPNAPALGSTVPISVIDPRLMNAVSRQGRIYTSHDVNVGGRAGVRWYEIDAASLSTIQVGTVSDPVFSYYYGSISVDQAGSVGLGFSGSHADSYVSAFVTGRRASDGSGLTAPPVLMKAGEGWYQQVDSYGRNRWGDYSLVAVDPRGETGFWTIQGYTGPNGNDDRTWIGRFGFEALPYGTGLAGSLGTPTLTIPDRPVLGTQVRLITSMTAPSAFTPAVLALGLGVASTPILGGLLLVQPDILHPFSVGVLGGQVSVAIPSSPAAVGVSIFCQSVQVDPGAVQGLAFTAGLELIPVPW